MKIVKLFYKLKNDLFLLALVCFCCVTVMMDIFMLVFNIIQNLISVSNSASLGNAFLCLNIITIVLNVLAIILIVVYLIFNSKNVKSKQIKK